MQEKNKTPKLHIRSKHHDHYDFKVLVLLVPEIKQHIIKNPLGLDTIDFSNPKAVWLLNQGLLMQYYQLKKWEIPTSNLCPPIPGRADYIHHLADLLAQSNNGNIPQTSQVKILDLGVGATLIYPIIGVAEYAWRFVGSDINKDSLQTAQQIINQHEHLKTQVELRWQENPKHQLRNIIRTNECFHAIMCNPPFFTSAEQATSKTNQKLRNLGKTPQSNPIRNFSGHHHELWCEGGEKAFIINYIYESMYFKDQVLWFTTLVSNKDNLRTLKHVLKKVKAKQVQIIPMAQGNKISRILAWQF